MRSTDERWDIGDEALLLEPIGRKGPRGGVTDRLGELAESKGMAPKTLRICRGVAHSWPKKHRRADLPWSVHAAFRGVPAPRKYTLIKERDWTTREALEWVKENVSTKD